MDLIEHQCNNMYLILFVDIRLTNSDALGTNYFAVKSNN